MAHKGDITALKTYPDLNAVKCKGKNVPGTNININATVRCLADEDLDDDVISASRECFCSCGQEEKELFIIQLGFMHQINSVWCKGCVRATSVLRVCACICGKLSSPSHVLHRDAVNNTTGINQS